jgi:putative FmdB family regulatory protein
LPLYEYECQACGHHLEVQQRMADAALTQCPACGKDELQKLISASAFHLKGGGWYKDLYASAKPGESTAKSDAGKPSTPSTETKSEPAKTSSEPSSTSAAPAASPKPSSTPTKSGT